MLKKDKKTASCSFSVEWLIVTPCEKQRSVFSDEWADNLALIAFNSRSEAREIPSLPYKLNHCRFMTPLSPHLTVHRGCPRRSPSKHTARHRAVHRNLSGLRGCWLNGDSDSISGSRDIKFCSERNGRKLLSVLNYFLSRRRSADSRRAETMCVSVNRRKIDIRVLQWVRL